MTPLLNILASTLCRFVYCYWLSGYLPPFPWLLPFSCKLINYSINLTVQQNFGVIFVVLAKCKKRNLLSFNNRYDEYDAAMNDTLALHVEMV